jgi:hypothetical protein
VDRREARTQFAVIHCTGGDLLITATALALAALVARIRHSPLFGGRMALTAIPKSR